MVAPFLHTPLADTLYLLQGAAAAAVSRAEQHLSHQQGLVEGMAVTGLHDARPARDAWHRQLRHCCALQSSAEMAVGARRPTEQSALLSRHDRACPESAGTAAAQCCKNGSKANWPPRLSMAAAASIPRCCILLRPVRPTEPHS